MLSNDQLDKFENVKRNLDAMMQDQTFQALTSNISAMKSFQDTKTFALRWIARVEASANKLDDSSTSAVLQYAEQITRTFQFGGLRSGESVENAMARITADFKVRLPLLVFEILDAQGIAELSSEDLPIRLGQALETIKSAETHQLSNIANASTAEQARFHEDVESSLQKIRQTVEDASSELEVIKARARHISVESAQTQFTNAALRHNAQKYFWAWMSSILFCLLLFTLLWFPMNPPPLIRAIVDEFQGVSSVRRSAPVSVPLLIAASAYFTSLRLALIGVLGVGFAFSLRMLSAYFHMIEHNEHKLRVTNSIEAFVAAVLTEEQKDLVLSKLVESVTDFGESGILGKNADTPAFPSVIFDSITKNVGKQG